MLKNSIFFIVVLLALFPASSFSDVGISKVGKLLYDEPACVGDEINARVDGNTVVIHNACNLSEICRFNVEGNGFYFSRIGCIITVESYEGAALAVLRFYDVQGSLVWQRSYPVIINLQVAPDGGYIAFSSMGKIVEVDLVSHDSFEYPAFRSFQLGEDGRIYLLSGDSLFIYNKGLLVKNIYDKYDDIVKCFYDLNSNFFYLCTRNSLLRLDEENDTYNLIFQSENRIRDVFIVNDTLYLGIQCREGEYCRGRLIKLSRNGETQEIIENEECQSVRMEVKLEEGNYPWPVEPFEGPHTIGNSYGVIQCFGSYPYLHPGIDIMGEYHQPVYSVSKGVVRAVLTTSATYHWRVLVNDTASAGTDMGWIYAHLIQSSIPYDDGDTVNVGDFMGEYVNFPDFEHLHFARVQNRTASWYDGWWYCTQNPLLLLEHHTELYPPYILNVFDDEPFAFSVNNRDNVYLNPDSLYGKVDIIVQTADYYNTSFYMTDVYEIRYSIKAFDDSSLIVDDKLGYICNQGLDSYYGWDNYYMCNTIYKRDSVCNSSYPDGPRYYHIITNSDGDSIVEPSDTSSCWDTGILPDGDYIIEVTILDVSENSDTESMIVSVKNRTAIDEKQTIIPGEFECNLYPNPFNSIMNIDIILTQAAKIDIGIFNIKGELIENLAGKELCIGQHRFLWQGTDYLENPVSSGVYLVELNLDGKMVNTYKTVLCR
ncbi:peptidoglycan DD-metalloendopeptidase family protein [bacterium]|nr:peptidoglycan DD-metalloendopeptidase family protein [bacterium]